MDRNVGKHQPFEHDPTGEKMKIYIAHNYEAKTFLKEQIVPIIEKQGHIVTSTWITQDAPQDELTAAIDDLEDLEAASILIFYARNYGERPGRGKYVELGYAIRAGKAIIIYDSDDKCVFYKLPHLIHCESLEHLKALLKKVG
jgi:nucleoside 2-deoxyribosyltransferase